MKYFIAVVTKQVVQRHLVDPLPKGLLPPFTVLKLIHEEIHSVACERSAVSAKRDSLEQRKKMLESAQDSLRQAMIVLRRYLFISSECSHPRSVPREWLC